MPKSSLWINPIWRANLRAVIESFGPDELAELEVELDELLESTQDAGRYQSTAAHRAGENADHLQARIDQLRSDRRASTAVKTFAQNMRKGKQ